MMNPRFLPFPDDRILVEGDNRYARSKRSDNASMFTLTVKKGSHQEETDDGIMQAH
jgi:hypothetical protein